MVNCLILGRAEAFASKNGVICGPLLDGLGMGVGFVLALFCLGSGARDLRQRHAVRRAALPRHGFQPWVMMILPSGGFFTLAGWLLLFNVPEGTRGTKARAAGSGKEVAA